MKSTFSGLYFFTLTVRVYLHSFSRCCLPNARNQAKLGENSNL